MMELNGVSQIVKSQAKAKSTHPDLGSKATYQLYNRKPPVLSMECITKFGGKKALLDYFATSGAMDAQTEFIKHFDA